MGIIKKIKKKIAKGLEITLVHRVHERGATDYFIGFSDTSGIHGSTDSDKKAKKLDSFLYLTERVLERKAAKEKIEKTQAE